MSCFSNGKNDHSHQLAQIGLVEVRRCLVLETRTPGPSRATVLVHWESAYLDLAQLSGALHPAGHVHRVAPDIVLRLPGSDHTGDHRAMVDPWPDRGTRVVRRLTSVNIWRQTMNYWSTTQKHCTLNHWWTVVVQWHRKEDPPLSMSNKSSPNIYETLRNNPQSIRLHLSQKTTVWPKSMYSDIFLGFWMNRILLSLNKYIKGSNYVPNI